MAPVAVITGGASGIGQAAATRFAEAGWAVMIGDLDEDRSAALAKALGPHAAHRPLDVSSGSSITAFRDAVYEVFPTIDALINSAGILQNPVRLADLDIAEFDRIH